MQKGTTFLWHFWGFPQDASEYDGASDRFPPDQPTNRDMCEQSAGDGHILLTQPRVPVEEVEGVLF